MKKQFRALLAKQLVLGATACTLAFLPLGALRDCAAMPNMGGGSAAFVKADKNQDGVISHDEFAEGFPGIQDQAFHIIDADKSNTITPEEWGNFMQGHSKDTAEHNAKAGMGGNGTMTNDGQAPLLLLPPDK